MECFNTINYHQSNDSDTSLEDYSTNLDLLCTISQFCCLNNMEDYNEFFESKIEKNIDNSNNKTTKTE